MNTIHLMVGIQGSGKTTFSKKLSEELGIKISINISAGIKKSVLHNMNAEDYKQLCRIIGEAFVSTIRNIT